MTIDAHAFLAAVAQPPIPTVWALATVDPAYSSGQPRLIFDGETTLSTKTYTRLLSYTPAAGDRVLVALVGNSAVILDKVG